MFSVADVHDWFACRIGDANEPSSATTWWSTLSEFLNMTLSPWLTVTEYGEKPVLLMVTVLVAAAPAAARMRAPATVASVPETIFGIVGTSLGLHRR